MNKINTFLWSYAFKDLFKQKVRTIFGILGISISILLLSTVSFAMDSLSSSFVDYVTSASGNQDITLSVRHYAGEPANRTQYFHYNPIIAELQQEISEIENFIPRSYFSGFYRTNYSDDEEPTYRTRIAALNFTLEESIGFGRWENIEQSIELNAGLPINSCFIDTEFANQYKLQVGDVIEVRINTLDAYVNLTIASIYQERMKFPTDDFSQGPPQIVVDISWWGDTANKINQNPRFESFDFIGSTNNLVLLLENAAHYYDIRDITQTEIDVVSVGEKIINTLGIEAWNLDYPKLQLLFLSEYLALVMNMIFMIITIVAMLIAGILINGILTTSVEEKIQEYGINRVLGARSDYNLKLILIQGTILAFLGTTLGVVGATFLVRNIALPIIQQLLTDSGVYATVQFVVNPTSVLLSFALGIGVSLLVSITPALKVKRMNIIEAINPYRHSDEIYRLEEKKSGNVKIIAFGVILAFNGLFVYFLLPQALLSLNIGMIAGLLITTLLIFLIGISLVAVGFMPIIIRILIKLFEPFAKKFMDIVKINVHRHQRRNTSTIVILILSFSFILFTTSTVEIQVNQIGELIQFNQGSDLQVIPYRYDINTPTSVLSQELMQIEGIERTSSLLASARDLSEIFSEDGKRFSAQLGDYINFNSRNIRFYGIDQNYQEIVYNQDSIIFTQGNREEAFEKVFTQGENNIIISTALSLDLDLNAGDFARLTIERGDEQEIVIATIVGVASAMPGLNRFKENINQANFGGVLCADFNYIEYFNIPGGDYAYLDRVFIKTMVGADSNQIENSIREYLGENSNSFVRNSARNISGAQDDFKIIQYVFVFILGGTIVIGLFGLIASAYSSLLERKREVGIIRTLGLHGNEVRKLFTIENMILLLGSSISGGLIGFTMSYLLTNNMILFTETPSKVNLPWDIVALIYGFSIIFLLIGMRFIMRKVQKANLIQIFRETL